MIACPDRESLHPSRRSEDNPAAWVNYDLHVEEHGCLHAEPPTCGMCGADLNHEEPPWCNNHCGEDAE